MPKVGMQPIRRAQLIEATIRTINKYGYADTTVSRIARTAGLSVGIISHYFGGKDSLLEATMQHLLFSLHRDLADNLREASTPEERLDAMIETILGPEQNQSEVVTAWLAFWAQVPFSDRLERIQNIYNRRLLSNTRHVLKQLGVTNRVDTLAELIAAFIDGYWLRSVLSHQVADPSEARAMVRDMIRSHL
ncbi:choline-responsive transcriptional repressor BetI [Emcibacter sp.]|uniref:choline-binding transcriptional repressor BetI n=1 Tax=Emcibacter sp. TaxID=1979954 RepID=UPI002AA6C2CA|nr:transcriptional regulator BetI [Emcibacter sp.]